MQVVHMTGRGSVANKVHYDRLARRPGGSQQLIGHLRCWRLGDEHDDARFGVTAEQVEPLAGRDCAHCLGEIAPAGAESVGDATPQLVDAGAHLL